MSFLESRINEISENYTPPAKEGGLSALSGGKISGMIGINIYTLPQFHHSFSLFKKALQTHSFEIVGEVIERCRTQCTVDLELIHGNNMKDLNMHEKCVNDHKSKLIGPFMHDLKKAENQANMVFNSCLAEKTKDEILYEQVLECKKKAFNYFLEKNLDAEEQLLINSLNRFA